MITMGLDIGSEFAKAVILEDKSLLASAVTRSSDEAEVVARKVADQVLREASLSIENIEKMAATGCGRGEISFVKSNYSEVVCHARGAVELFPRARTILAMGAHGSMALKLDDSKKVKNFVTSDKCAGGAGSFLSAMAKVLFTSTEEFDCQRDKSRQSVNLSNFCAVFAESEVISLIHNKTPKEDIIAAVINAVSDRLLALLKRIRVEEDLVLTGGVANIRGLIDLFREKLKVPVYVPYDPMIGAALGAALLAGERR